MKRPPTLTRQPPVSNITTGIILAPLNRVKDNTHSSGILLKLSAQACNQITVTHLKVDGRIDCLLGMNEFQDKISMACRCPKCHVWPRAAQLVIVAASPGLGNVKTPNKNWYRPQVATIASRRNPQEHLTSSSQ